MSFLDIYGHEKQISILKQALAQKRIGHAYLFSGFTAIGKKTLALEFAQALNCEKVDQNLDSCGECPTCLKIKHRSHPDIFFIETESQFIRINVIREIQEQMTFKPMEGGWRVFVIDDADKMNDQAANALLKTLEEPSLANILILVTSRPYLMPSTIISRCRHMRFNPLNKVAITKFLIDRMGIESNKALLLAALSGGSPGQAIKLDKNDFVNYRTELLKLLSITQGSNPFSIINFVSFLEQGKKEIKQGLDILNSFFRDALVFKEIKKTEILINADISSFVASIASRLSGKQILQNIALVESAGEAIERNSNKLLTLETMAFRLTY